MAELILLSQRIVLQQYDNKTVLPDGKITEISEETNLG